MSQEKSALLVKDVQPSIVQRIDNQDEYLKRVSQAVDYAHKNEIKVIYIVVGFRKGMPEINLTNKSFSAIKASSQDDALINPMPMLSLTDNDILIQKKRVSAFSGSDLEMILRSNGITNLVLCGIATSGVVLSTVREAADKDFKLSVLEDLCVDFDQQVHELLISRVFPRQAAVLNSSQWISAGEGGNQPDKIEKAK
ncbi:MAG TPA: isochorismatase family cysteine hydrolase [Candidatus Saccharimonadales bacterium]|nr:isochorismatase family cysteine hydrolase [Candidatus Saccharimonadales bacterium]